MKELTVASAQVNTKKENAEKAKAALEIKSGEALERKTFVEGKLARAEPALIEAQQAVQGVTPANIVELKNFANPPPAVKLALEPVITLLSGGAKKPDWAEIKKKLTDPKFKDNVLKFDKDSISSKTKAFIFNTYLKNEGDYDLEKFMKASKAAGPLAKWLKSIIEYAEIYEQIEPMRKEVYQLEQEQAQMQ